MHFFCCNSNIFRLAKPVENATEAMDLVDKRLNVPKVLVLVDLVNSNVDKQSMLTYISQFPNAKLKFGVPLGKKTNIHKVQHSYDFRTVYRVTQMNKLYLLLTKIWDVLPYAWAVDICSSGPPAARNVRTRSTGGVHHLFVSPCMLILTTFWRLSPSPIANVT